ncbi:MAG: 3-hydroxyacyl-CoA dehydrogenase/enoyl-CoA hydratase family protein [Caldisphaeraceae archaeon]|nr:3-hydroxyacyl-CoA dehydrogenase/enoyl-CoA hydratase family protein [Caldisphaeraceae archaeon]
MDTKKIGVIGSGTMGHGIAEVSALNGFDVIMVDISEEILNNAISKISENLSKLISRNKITDIMKKISTSTNYSDLRDCDIIIEAVPENYELKAKVFREIASYLKEDTILGTNTSTIPINDLAKETSREDKFIGIHFMNSPTLIPLVEIILGKKTSQETLNEVLKYLKIIKKDYVILKKDVPGFLVNRINAKTFIESIIMLEEENRKEDIDAMARFRLGLPMGFFELLDYIGIDVVYNALNEMIKRGEKLLVPKTLEKMVKDGRFGVKSGIGFYNYPSRRFKKQLLIPNDAIYKLNPGRIIAVAANEAAWLISNDVATKEDIEKSMILGMNWPHGLLYFADHYGLDNILKILKNRYAETKLQLYEANTYLEQFSRSNIGVRSGRGFSNYSYSREDIGPVSYEIIENYALITIRRPNRLNALNEDVWKNIRVFLEKAENNRNVYSVVLTGEGSSFSSGDDIEMMKNWTNSAAAKRWLEELAWPLVNKMLNYTKPIIAAVKGYAFGGGMELTFLSDIVISTENAIFSVPESLIAAFPPIVSPIGTYLTNKRIVRYALTGDWLNAEEARNLGVVDIIVPEDQLDIMIFEITNKLSKLSPLSLRAIKNALNSSKTLFVNPLKNSLNELVILADSKDFSEGMRAFLEKRKPIYRGE